MKRELKYHVEYTIDDSLREEEIIVSKSMCESLKNRIIEEIKNVTRPGTKVEVKSIKYIGTVLRIPQDDE